MAGYNRIIMTGNLTKDPEVRTVGASSVCRLQLASNRQYRNKTTGAVVQEVCFIDIEVWGAQAESCKSYLAKGRSILVEGRLKLDTWKDNEGNTRSKHSIISDKVVFLNSGDNAHNNNEDSMSSDDSLHNSVHASSSPIAPSVSMGSNKPKAPSIKPEKNESKKDTFVSHDDDELPF